MTTDRIVRTAAALTKRRSGIDYDGVPDSLADRAIEPGDRGYHRYTASYLRSAAPGLILRPQSAEQTRDAVQFTDRHRGFLSESSAPATGCPAGP